MYYVLVEGNRVSNIINYEPNVPDGIEVFAITDDQYILIANNTHYFSPKEKKVIEIPKEVAEHQLALKAKKNDKSFLAETDWKVLRHIRELALKLPTTLSEEEYITLEEKRQAVAKAIVN